MRAHFNLPGRKTGLAVGAIAVSLIGCFLWLKTSRKPVPVGQQLSGLNPATNAAVGSLSETSEVTVSPPWSAPDVGEREVVGIGVALARPNVANGVVQIRRVLPDSPAELAGLRPGMNVHKVDGISLKGLPLSETTRLIRGPVGTTVQLELYEGLDGEKFTIELTRQKLKL